MSNVSPTDLDDLAAGLEFIGKQLHEYEIEQDGQDRMIGAGYLCKLLSRQAKELAMQADEDPNMTPERIQEEGRNHLSRIK